MTMNLPPQTPAPRRVYIYWRQDMRLEPCDARLQVEAYLVNAYARSVVAA